MSARTRVRHLVLVLGDQLTTEAAAFDDLDPARDALWMAEAAEEATHVRAHQQKLVLFFSAMRHFRDRLRADGHTVHYHALTADPEADRGHSLAALLEADLARLRPRRVLLAEPGDWRVRQSLERSAQGAGVPLEILPDRHFYCRVEDFRDWAGRRKTLVLEHFYRWLRRREGILVDEDGRPEGGRWNLDADNRASFGKDGPGEVPEPPRFEPDALTREVIALVAARFADHPGRAEDFAQAVTPAQAEQALEDFVRHRLPDFGRYQDALWSGQPFLYHSRLSAVLNLHLLDPRRAVAAAIEAYRESHAPLNSVEGFVRQVLGWREFVRGLYWTRMPEYAGLNALGAEQPLPVFYWDGDTEMRCIRRSMGEALDHAYGHHIQRLMVLGLFAQLLGVQPYRFHEWHMALYADAVDWVSLPNALGMSQHGDGGMMATKPYCASGRYIQRMSNYCRACRYDPARATGDKACPFTTLYWDFLERHGERFRDNRRMRFQLGNLARKSSGERQAIRDQAEALRQRLESGERQ